MDESVKYPFSIYYGLRSLLALAFIIISFPPFNNHWNSYQLTDFVIIIIFDFTLLLTVIVSVFKFIIPAIRSDIALEINKTGIKYFKSSRNIDWESINDIHLCTGKYYDYLLIDLKDKKKYTSRFKDPLKIFIMWCSNIYYRTPLIILITIVKGNNRSIYNITKRFLTNYKNEKNIQII
jgi:hypothetical protein